MKILGICFLLLIGTAITASADCPDPEGALQERWLNLWSRLESQGAEGDHHEVYRDLAARYCESHRVYHNLAHLKHALNELDEVRDLTANPETVELALWFHDVVYVIGTGDNEEESAQLARAATAGLGLAREWADSVSDLILATRHNAAPLSADARLVVDIDLAILGQPWERFDAYEDEIRREYAPLIEERGTAGFNSGRARILRRFLDRPTIYSTDYFRRKYEEPARANLKRSIERLEGSAWTEPMPDGQNRPNS